MSGKKVELQPKLCMEDRLLLCLEYLREYRTYLHIGISYGVSESQAFRIQRWVETEILKDEQFHLPGRKQLLDADYEIETILTDASEIPVERPKKKHKNKNRKNKQKHYYSGKKKQHTLKVQLLVNKNTKEIICTYFCEGKKHDYQLFKDSGVRFKKGQKGLLDTGYQGDRQNLS